MRIAFSRSSVESYLLYYYSDSFNYLLIFSYLTSTVDFSSYALSNFYSNSTAYSVFYCFNFSSNLDYWVSIYFYKSSIFFYKNSFYCWVSAVSLPYSIFFSKNSSFIFYNLDFVSSNFSINSFLSSYHSFLNWSSYYSFLVFSFSRRSFFYCNAICSF